MKILAIGGTGFISSNLVEELVNRDNHVTILTRGKAPYILPKNDHIKFIVGDRNDENFMREVASNYFDVVYDMIAFTGEQSEMAIKVFEGKMARFIHMSTVSVYMVSNDIQSPIVERDHIGPIMDFWANNPFGMQYGIDKRKCEEVLWEAYKRKNFPVTMARAPYVCGPRDPALRDFFWIQRIMDGNPLIIPGSGDYATQSVYVKDLAKALADFIEFENAIGEAYNVASEEIYSLNDYLDKLSALLNKEPERYKVDLDVFEKLPFSTSKEGHAFPFNVYRTAIFSLDKIKKDINYKSTPFEEWMPETIDWYLHSFSENSVGYAIRNKEIEFIERWKKYLNEKNNIFPDLMEK